MPSPLVFFLGATAPLSLSVVVLPPREPVPPVVDGNVRSYSFGAEQGGAPAGSASEPSVPPQKAAPPGGEVQSIGPHECRTVGADVQVCTPVRRDGGGPKMSPADLAMAKWARLPIPAPRVRTAPPRRNGGLVGLPEWFWVTNWQPLSGRAAAGAVWVEVNAVPQRMTIEPGDGRHSVGCTGPGTAYDRSKPAASQRTDCSYTYSRSSALQPKDSYRVRVAVVWGGTWHGSDGSGGVLPPLSRSTSFRLRIAEAQGLYG